MWRGDYCQERSILICVFVKYWDLHLRTYWSYGDGSYSSTKNLKGNLSEMFYVYYNFMYKTIVMIDDVFWYNNCHYSYKFVSSLTSKNCMYVVKGLLHWKCFGKFKTSYLSCSSSYWSSLWHFWRLCYSTKFFLYDTHNGS